jgi:hypothetical protein
MPRTSSTPKGKVRATGALALAVLLPAIALTIPSGPAAAQRSCAQIAEDLQFNLNMFGQMAGSNMWDEALTFALRATRISGEYYGARC